MGCGGVSRGGGGSAAARARVCGAAGGDALAGSSSQRGSPTRKQPDVRSESTPAAAPVPAEPGRALGHEQAILQPPALQVTAPPGEIHRTAQPSRLGRVAAVTFKTSPETAPASGSLRREAAATAARPDETSWHPEATRSSVERPIQPRTVSSGPTPALLTPPAYRPRFQATATSPPTTSEPSVQVTIGRIEVRASTEPTRQKEKTAPPVMGLDEYLKTRTRGEGR